MNQVFQWMNDDENIKKGGGAVSSAWTAQHLRAGRLGKKRLYGKRAGRHKGAGAARRAGKGTGRGLADRFAVLAARHGGFGFSFCRQAVFTTTAKSIERSAQQMRVLGFLREGRPGVVLATAEEAFQYVLPPQRIDDGAVI